MSQSMAWYFSKVISEELGLDLSDPNLRETPQRLERMYQEIFANVGKEFTDFKAFPNDRDYKQLIMFDTIHFVSWCSHHFLPFEGKAWLGYIPKELLVGASKPARLINHYSLRPQLQETLCDDVIKQFDRHIKPYGTIVAMRAIHGCMRCRGVKQQSGSGMTTSALSGVLMDDLKARDEAMRWIEMSLIMGG